MGLSVFDVDWSSDLAVNRYCSVRGLAGGEHGGHLEAGDRGRAGAASGVRLARASRGQCLTMLGAIVLSAGCFRSVAKPGAPVPAVGSRIGLKYAVATDVRAITTSGDTVTLPRMQS